MKIFTDRQILVRLTNVPFTASAYETLLKLSLTAPNLRLEAVEFHTQKATTVRLCVLDFDWSKVNAVNLPVA